MGTSSTPAILRGILVPDPRFVWSESGITAESEQGARVGVPKASDESEMVLEATGTQTVDMDIKTVRGGHPGQGAAMVWRPSDGADWRGWDPPVSLSGGLEMVDATTSVDRWLYPHALALADGTICIAVLKDSQVVTVWRRDVSTGAWSEAAVYDRGSTFTNVAAHPCLVQTPSGRLLLLHWREFATGSRAQIWMHYSDDSGSTWNIGQKGCLSPSVDVSAHVPGRLRCAHLAGQLCMVAAMVEQTGPEDQIYQWSSNDLGATFDLVSTMTGTNRAFPDIVEHDGMLVTAYISDTGSTGSTRPPYVRSIGSAYELVADAQYYLGQRDSDSMQWGTTSGGVFSSGDLSMWSDEDGRLWLIGRDHGTGENEVKARTSSDGETWVEPGEGPAAGLGVSTWRGRDANTYPTQLAACAHRGRAMLAHTHAADPGTRDPSLGAVWLGGYTTVCLAQSTFSRPSALTVAGWTETWLPYDFPDDIGSAWTVTSTGSHSLTPTGMRLQTSAGQQEMYSTTGLPGTITEGIVVLAEVQIVSGSAFMELRLSDSSPKTYTVQINVSATQIDVWDAYGSATIGSVSTTLADGAFVQVLASAQDNNVKVWFRPSHLEKSDQEWSLVASTSIVTGSAVSLTHRVLFGQNADSDTFWRLVCLSSDEYTEGGLYDQINWSDLLGRDYMPTPVWVDDGLSAMAVDGPTFRGDDWVIKVDHEYPVRALMPDVAPSPRWAWRSVDDIGSVDIEVGLGTATTYLMGQLLGVMLVDANFPLAEIHGQDSLGTWHVIGTMDRRAQTGLHWSRRGRIVDPAAGGAAVPWYGYTHILAGSYLSFAGAGEGRQTRRIETNEAGRWNASIAGTQNVRVLLDEIDGTESLSGTDAQLWMRDSAHVVPLTTAYKRLRIRILQADTAEGYYRIGSMVLGHVHPTGSFLDEPGWGHVREWSYDWEMVEGRTGTRDIVALGPTRRSVEIAWVDGVNTLGAQTDAEPNWVIGWTGGSAVAVPSDVPWSVPGLIDRLSGAVHPIGYLSAFAIPPNDTTVINITDRTLQLYGRIVTESIRADNVNGDPESGEVIRLGTCRMEEEV